MSSAGGVTHLTPGAGRARDAWSVMEILIFAVLLLAGVVYGYYTVDGSGTAEHPYGDIHGGAPGALGPGAASGRDERVSIGTWSRGTH